MLLLLLKAIKSTPGIILKKSWKITRGRCHHKISKQNIKMTIFLLDIHPQGGSGCQKNEKSPQNLNLLVLGATMKFKSS